MKKIFILICLVLNFLLLFGQNNLTWIGSVVDNENQPVPNFNIIIQNYSISAVTSQDGSFIFNLPKTIEAGSDIIITSNDKNYKFMEVSIGSKKTIVNSKGEIETLLPASLKDKPIKITVYNTTTKRIIFTYPKFKEKNTWADSIITDWMPISGGPDDFKYEINGIVNKPPINGYLKISLTNQFGTWEQDETKINDDGTWSSFVWLKKSDGNKYWKNINVLLLDENKKQVDSYIISIK
jgi:hypothetical protein